jgi:hypothetical protein
MMNLRQAIFFGIFLGVHSVFAGLPFGTEWNLTGEEVHGAIKTIRTAAPSQTLVDQYNENRQLTSRQYLNANRSLQYERVCSYSLFGELKSVSQFAPGSDQPEQVETATYSLPNQFASLKQSRAGTDESATVAEFDYEDGEIRSIWLQSPTDGSNFSWELSEDPEGARQSWKYLRGSVCVEETIRTLNPQGDPERIESYAAGQKIGVQEFEYRYDEHGNWIQRTQRSTTYDEGQAVQQSPSVTRRKIEYYDGPSRGESAQTAPSRPAPTASEFLTF